MKAQDINSTEDCLIYIEGCLNDFESAVSTKAETMNLFLDMAIRIHELAGVKIEALQNHIDSANKQEDFNEEKPAPYLGQIGTVGIIYNWNNPEDKKPVNCELLAIYKDGRIVVQCYDIHGEKWESETFSRIEFFTPKTN